MYKQFFGFMTASFLAASPYSVLFSRHVIHAGVELPPNSAGTTSGAVWAAENVATQHSPARHERCVRGADEGGRPQPHVASTAGCRFSTCDAAACALATGHARVPVPKSMPSPGPSLFMATSCVCVCGVCVRVCACVCVWARFSGGHADRGPALRMLAPQRHPHAQARPHLLCRVLDALLHRQQQLCGHRAAVAGRRGLRHQPLGG